MFRINIYAFVVGSVWLTTQTHARDFFVDPDLGNDRANGLAAKQSGSDAPVKSIARGLKIAGPGDTVHLAPVVFKESAIFFNRAGEPGKPITLDGHGATLDGSELLNPGDWQEVSPGLFRCDHLLRHDDAVIQRWFFLWDGKMNHMNRTSKGPRAPFKKPEDLQPGEWTYVKEANPPADPRFNNGTFFVKIEPGEKLGDAHIAAPIRSAGVQFSGTNSHIAIRNVIATHVYNDGFNLHGASRDCSFEKIAALECGDDGISAHDDIQFHVNGLVSIGNSTGIADTGGSVTDYTNVFVRDCLGIDLLFFQPGKHSVRDAVVLSSASHAMSLSGTCALLLENVLIRRIGENGDAIIDGNATLDAKRTTFIGVSIRAAASEIRLHDSVLTGTTKPKIVIYRNAKWEADRNIYDAASFLLEKTTFLPQQFADFQNLSGQDKTSRWQNVEMRDSLPIGLPGGFEADVEKLRAIFGDKMK